MIFIGSWGKKKKKFFFLALYFNFRCCACLEGEKKRRTNLTPIIIQSSLCESLGDVYSFERINHSLSYWYITHVTSFRRKIFHLSKMIFIVLLFQTEIKLTVSYRQIPNIQHDLIRWSIKYTLWWYFRFRKCRE